LTRKGTAYCWGYGAFGQIGDGTTGDSPIPTLVSGF
jgi:alpha-tubulin suppressor-like RCC1 family protein